MPDETAPNSQETRDERIPSGQFRSLGLITNPFVQNDPQAEPFIELETRAQANRLLAAADAEADAARPKVIWVEKAELPPSYSLQAVAFVEHELVNDPSLNLLHAYVQLAMMRMGRIRGILQVVTERLAFGRLDKTIAAYLERVLAEPDTDLDSYRTLGNERLTAFTSSFEQDPLAAVHTVFGLPELERHMELSNVMDLRPTDLETDVDESVEGIEIEPDYREARGVSDGAIEQVAEDRRLALGDGTEEASPDSDENAEETLFDDAVFEYIAEYTQKHLSPVIARALRAYRVRGVAVAATELTITKAPKKTLAAVLKFARCRFRRVVVLFDSFEAWPLADAELRSKVIGSVSEVRTAMADDLEMVFLIEKDVAPELEEQFGHGVRLHWDFENLDTYFADPAAMAGPAVIDSWLASATLPGAAPLTSQDPVLVALRQRSGDVLRDFVRMANAAIDDAAARGASRLDDEALSAALSAIVKSE